MTTFWCEPTARQASTYSVSDTSKSDLQLGVPITIPTSSPNVHERLVEWNVDLFAGLLKGIVAQRVNSLTKRSIAMMDPSELTIASTGKPADEVVEIIDLPVEDGGSCSQLPGDIQISPLIMLQLRLFITAIAGKYQANPFHNFEHASHVVMSTKKLLHRISESLKEVKETSPSRIAGTLHLDDVTGDPLTQFAIVFAALIHDVDHPGVSNAQLVSEEHELATTYEGKSVAEQNSIDIAWKMLMQPEYKDLQSCIFATLSDYARFRQIVVNIVMATDLFDQDLKSMREACWNKTFSSGSKISHSDSCHRATIILQLIIQASDVSHTMQHFTVYKKWNMCLLTEMYQAYGSGRTSKDPLEGWYEGELWFFDNYIIPLAEKLRECGVFGVACDELLDYAKDNRLEWQIKGRDIVREAANVLRSREHFSLTASPTTKASKSCQVKEEQKPKVQPFFL
jgi:3'5'-cyclic nucleotide phosphodiesterase